MWLIAQYFWYLPLSSGPPPDPQSTFRLFYFESACPCPTIQHRISYIHGSKPFLGYKPFWKCSENLRPLHQMNAHSQNFRSLIGLMGHLKTTGGSGIQSPWNKWKWASSRDRLPSFIPGPTLLTSWLTSGSHSISVSHFPICRMKIILKSTSGVVVRIKWDNVGKMLSQVPDDMVKCSVNVSRDYLHCCCTFSSKSNNVGFFQHAFKVALLL